MKKTLNELLNSQNDSIIENLTQTIISNLLNFIKEENIDIDVDKLQQYLSDDNKFHSKNEVFDKNKYVTNGCSYIFTKGNRKGETCGKICVTFPGVNFCRDCATKVRSKKWITEQGIIFNDVKKYLEESKKFAKNKSEKNIEHNYEESDLKHQDKKYIKPDPTVETFNKLKISKIINNSNIYIISDDNYPHQYVSERINDKNHPNSFKIIKKKINGIKKDLSFQDFEYLKNIGFKIDESLMINDSSCSDSDISNKLTNVNIISDENYIKSLYEDSSSTDISEKNLYEQ